MTDDDKAALIAEAREWQNWHRRISHSENQVQSRLFAELADALEFQPDLERVKREAGAAALREFADWWDAPDTIREFHMPSTRARSMADRIERGE